MIMTSCIKSYQQHNFSDDLKKTTFSTSSLCLLEISWEWMF